MNQTITPAEIFSQSCAMFDQRRAAAVLEYPSYPDTTDKAGYDEYMKARRTVDERHGVLQAFAACDTARLRLLEVQPGIALLQPPETDGKERSGNLDPESFFVEHEQHNEVLVVYACTDGSYSLSWPHLKSSPKGNDEWFLRWRELHETLNADPDRRAKTHTYLAQNNFAVPGHHVVFEPIVSARPLLSVDPKQSVPGQ